MRLLRHFASALLLALVVLLGQHAVALHALGHAADELTQADSKQAPQKCEEHSLFASLASGVGSQAPAAAYLAAAHPLHAVVAPALVALAPRYSFRSRAPPATPA